MVFLFVRFCYCLYHFYCHVLVRDVSALQKTLHYATTCYKRYMAKCVCGLSECSLAVIYTHTFTLVIQLPKMHFNTTGIRFNIHQYVINDPFFIEKNPPLYETKSRSWDVWDTCSRLHIVLVLEAFNYMLNRFTLQVHLPKVLILSAIKLWEQQVTLKYSYLGLKYV